MPATIGFPLFLGATVLLLASAIATGLARRRRVHLALVAATFTGLGLAIFFAERLGQLYDLEAAGRIYPIHLAVAKLATLCYLAPVVTGIRLLRGSGTRRWHRKAAVLVVLMTLLTATTGSWMLHEAPRRAAADLTDP